MSNFFIDFKRGVSARFRPNTVGTINPLVGNQLPRLSRDASHQNGPAPSGLGSAMNDGLEEGDGVYNTAPSPPPKLPRQTPTTLPVGPHIKTQKTLDSTFNSLGTTERKNTLTSAPPPITSRISNQTYHTSNSAGSGVTNGVSRSAAIAVSSNHYQKSEASMQPGDKQEEYEEASYVSLKLCLCFVFIGIGIGLVTGFAVFGLDLRPDDLSSDAFPDLQSGEFELDLSLITSAPTVAQTNSPTASPSRPPLEPIGPTDPPPSPFNLEKVSSRFQVEAQTLIGSSESGNSFQLSGEGSTQITKIMGCLDTPITCLTVIFSDGVSKSAGSCPICENEFEVTESLFNRDVLSDVSCVLNATSNLLLTVQVNGATILGDAVSQEIDNLEIVEYSSETSDMRLTGVYGYVSPDELSIDSIGFIMVSDTTPLPTAAPTSSPTTQALS